MISMIYATDITTPASTDITTPKRTRIPVTKGLVYQIEVEFPPGPLGLCHCAIYDGSYQAWPSNPDGNFHGDNGYITFGDTYLKLSEPFEFVAVTWNEDDTYAHTIHIRIGLVSQEIFMARFLPTMSYDKMMEVFQQLQLQQTARAEAIIANPLPWRIA